MAPLFPAGTGSRPTSCRPAWLTITWRWRPTLAIAPRLWKT